MQLPLLSCLEKHAAPDAWGVAVKWYHTAQDRLACTQLMGFVHTYAEI